MYSVLQNLVSEAAIDILYNEVNGFEILEDEHLMHMQLRRYLQSVLTCM